MAWSTTHNHEDVMSVAEFIDFVDEKINVKDDESVKSSAYALHSLSNNKNEIINIYNEQLKRVGETDSPIYSQSSAILGRGKKQGFVVRTNLWPTLTSSDSRVQSIEESLFSYNLPHDHNFSFLTANVLGSGYETEVWEYSDSDRPEGYVGRDISLRFLERTALVRGKQIFFRRCKDIHIQYAPESFTVSVNLMMPDDKDIVTDQYVIDIGTKKIESFPGGCASSRRAFLLKTSAMFGNEDTSDILAQIARNHPCNRTRAAALESFLKMTGEVDLMLRSIGNDSSCQIRRVFDEFVKAD